MELNNKLKVLNLYAGIGGNRKLWENVEVTAIELNESIAEIYKDFFPNDKVIIADAHQYLLEHFKEYDFIWSSPPCQTHTQLMRGNVSRWDYKAYPDMSLYQEIIWLQNFYKGKYCIENVKSYYTPLIEPKYIGKHYVWTNFDVGKIEAKGRGHDRKGGSIQDLSKKKGFDLTNYKIIDKRQILRNCTEPELGLHILDCARNIITKEKTEQYELTFNQ